MLLGATEPNAVHQHQCGPHGHVRDALYRTPSTNATMMDWACHGMLVQSYCAMLRPLIFIVGTRMGPTQDERFFVKTVSKAELELLLGMLPAYYRHIERNPHTLLTKFYGLHRVSRPGSKSVSGYRQRGAQATWAQQQCFAACHPCTRQAAIPRLLSFSYGRVMLLGQRCGVS